MKRQDTVAACHIDQGVIVVATRIICLAMPYERIAGYGSRIAISLIQHIQSQMDNTITQNTDARKGIHVSTCYGVRCTAEQIRLTLLDRCGICHGSIYLRSTTGADRQINDHYTVLTRQMKRVPQSLRTGFCKLVGLATQEVNFACLNLRLVLYRHFRRNDRSGLDIQRQESDTILAY